MIKQMCWLSSNGNNGNKVLHLRTQPNQAWQPYTAFPQYAAPDYQIPGGSQGWATYQKLRAQGWTLELSTQLHHTSGEQTRKSA